MSTKFVKIERKFKDGFIHDISAAVSAEFDRAVPNIREGDSIAIAVGSRGINNIAVITKAVVANLKAIGAKPFIIPAMGSHGGATAEGQAAVLEGYGITEETMSAPVRSSLQVVELKNDGLQNRVFMDKHAYNADGTIIINRVKPHTDFHGPVESGLMKMCVIGLGKHRQALEMHSFGVYGLRELIPPTAREVLKQGNIRMGIGLVENSYDHTSVIRAAKAEGIEALDAELIGIARSLMPSFPVEKFDILIVDRMGKDISGVGIDSNIIGRMRIKGELEPQTPDITAIMVDDLTEASHGNATGLGLADFITKKLYNKIDFQATYENILTSTFPNRGMTPIVAADALEGMRMCLRIIGRAASAPRIIRIRDTLSLDRLYVTENIFEEICDRPDITELGHFDSIFDANELTVF